MATLGAGAHPWAMLDALVYGSGLAVLIVVGLGAGAYWAGVLRISVERTDEND